MYSKNRKPSEVIALQRQVIDEQERIISILKGALAAAGEKAPPKYEPWMVDLTSQEAALVGVLYRHYPRPVGKYQLLELIPGYDHVQERQAQIVNVKVHHVRNKLGSDAIETVRGMGYRLSARQHAAMRDKEEAELAPVRAEARTFRVVEARLAA